WRFLTEELEGLQQLPDSYLLHEHLEEINRPVLFHEFSARAEAHGLRYLGEALLGAMAATNFPPATEKALRQMADDVVQLEQYMDFVRDRPFRQTLLCRAQVAPEWSLKLERVAAFFVASNAHPVSLSAEVATPGEEMFRTAAGVAFAVSDPVLKIALSLLAGAWPAAVPLGRLAEAVGAHLPASPVAPQLNRALAVHLLRCYLGGLVDFHTHPAVFTQEVSDRPRASPLTRLLAREG